MATSLIKAPLGGAFFVSFLLLSTLPPTTAAAGCEAAANPQSARVVAVLDGDTLRLEDGRDLRLIGIDTPELAHGSGIDRPFAREAKAALQRLVTASEWRVLVQPGSDPRDRYGRTLAHVYAPDGTNLIASLLRQGMGYQAIVAPNLGHLACYREAESTARNRSLGLWRNGVRDARELATGEAGFHLMRGRVERIDTRRRAVWINLAGGVAIRIPWPVWRTLSEGEPAAYQGKRLEVRGWFYRYQGRLRLSLSHAAAIQWL